MSVTPFQPRTLREHKGRVRAALEPVYHWGAIVAEVCAGRGAGKQHVFDFAGGLRIIMTRESFPDGHAELHASWSPGHMRREARFRLRQLVPTTTRPPGGGFRAPEGPEHLTWDWDDVKGGVRGLSDGTPAPEAV